ncbi:hypothetical protein VP01_2798g1 [Puccinia sorghi]|uniref:RING-type domain-containing protein n=1 Tax=Puccinia sorghi TaxID=27349 RepID=A0A0L6V2K3_9BASI|nr:hypothetical protein VP01_2798g1 [Puccinia sorghi]
MSSPLVLILLVGRSVSMNCPQSSARLPYRGNDPVMVIEGLPPLTDEEAGMAIPRTVMPNSVTQSCLESSNHDQEGGSGGLELASIRIDGAAEKRKTGLDQAQSKEPPGEAQAAVTSLNGAGSIRMARLESRRPQLEECTICLSGMDPAESFSIEAWPGCEHEYHTECIQRWKLNNLTCPNCRRTLSGRIRELHQHPMRHQTDLIDHHQLQNRVYPRPRSTFDICCLCDNLFSYPS